VTNATLIGGGALPGEDNGKDVFQINKDRMKSENGKFRDYRINPD
jgi:hypothetical protein